MLEKDARNFLERTPYQYINIRRDWSGKGVNWEGGSDETTFSTSDTLPGEVRDIWHVTKEDSEDMDDILCESKNSFP